MAICFSCRVQGPFSCGMWDLVSQPGQHPVALQGSPSGMVFGSHLSPPVGHLSWTQQPVNLLITATATLCNDPSTDTPHPLTHSPRGSFLWILHKSLEYRKDVFGSKPDEFTAQPCPLPSCNFRQLISSFWLSGSSPGKVIQNLAQCFSNLI